MKRITSWLMRVWSWIITQRMSFLEMILIIYLLKWADEGRYGLTAGAFFGGILVITILQNISHEKARSLLYQLDRYKDAKLPGSDRAEVVRAKLLARAKLD